MKQQHNRRLPVNTTDTHQFTSADTPDYISRHTILHQQTHQTLTVTQTHIQNRKHKHPYTHIHTHTHTHTSLIQNTCQSTPVTLQSTSITYQSTIVIHSSTSTDTAVYTSNTRLQHCACWINWTRALLC